MPRKTKKRKIIAEYRRRLQQLSVESAPRVSVVVSEPTKKVEKPLATTNTLIHTDPSRLESAKTLTTKDLRKTVILSVLAICVELVLYWVTKS